MVVPLLASRNRSTLSMGQRRLEQEKHLRFRSRPNRRFGEQPLRPTTRCFRQFSQETVTQRARRKDVKSNKTIVLAFAYLTAAQAGTLTSFAGLNITSGAPLSSAGWFL